VDLPLLAELGIQRQHRQAVALGTAVAAALADRRVDDHPAGRLGQLAPLAQPPGLGRAALVVDDDRDPGNLPELLLHGGKLVAAVHLGPGAPLRPAGVVLRFLGADDDLAHALGFQGPGHRGHVHQPGDVLAAGHGHGRVVEDLEGDVGAARDAGPDRQGSRVAERAVAQVLDDVRLGDERLEADPGHALGAHRRRRQGLHADVAGLEVHDAVAADSPADEGAVGCDGRPVMRASAAEPGRAGGQGEKRQPRALPGRVRGNGAAESQPGPFI